MINEKDVGSLFTTNGKDVWRCMSYCGEPTATFENIETKTKTGGSVRSLNVADFKRLKVEHE